MGYLILLSIVPKKSFIRLGPVWLHKCSCHAQDQVKCDQNHNKYYNESGHTSLSCSDVQQKPPQELGCSKANRREPRTCLCRVFNYKLGRFGDVRGLIYVVARPHLQLKIRPRFSPVTKSLSTQEPTQSGSKIDQAEK